MNWQLFRGNCPNCKNEGWGLFPIDYAILSFRCACGWIFHVRKSVSST